MTPQSYISRRLAVLGLSGTALSFATGLRADELVHGAKGQVERVVSGGGFILDDGTSVRLSGIDVPRRALRDFPAWPFSEEALAGLTGLIHRRPVQLFHEGTREDRYGRRLAQVYTLAPDGSRDIWVQGEMVRLGLARVYSWYGETSKTAELLALEEEARSRQRGIWSDEFYAIRSPDPNPLAQHVDSVQIIEGVITSVAEVRGRAYLNFGADYKTDFTIAIAKKRRKRVAATGLDVLSLEGARVRVRGWIELINGPMIWVDHAERIEVLS